MNEVALTQEIVASPKAVNDANDSAQQELGQRYFASLDALFDDALEQHGGHVLGDALAWTLAKLIVHFGTSFVAGDVLHSLGGYVRELADDYLCLDCERAQTAAARGEEAEAEPARIESRGRAR